MKTYLAVSTGNRESMAKSGWLDLPPEERKAREAKGIAAWGDWMADHASALVYDGGPLGSTKFISKAGVKDISNMMAGFVVFTAETHDDAARKFIDHPHFTIFPGVGVEIMEALPIPEQ